MRQWNKELNAFAEYQKLCEERGEKPVYTTLGGFRRAYRSDKGTLAYEKTHYTRRDANQYDAWEKIIGKENMPRSLADFQELKYNKNRDKFELLQREKTTISDIKGKKWSMEFKQKAISTYYEFRGKNIELSDHGVARLIQRGFDKKKVIDICNNKTFNYLQEDGKRIKHYDKIAIVYAKNSDEIISVIDMKKPKVNWSNYDKTDN